MCGGLKGDYQLCEEMGRGRFGVVYRCYSAANADSFACKSISKHSLSDSTDRNCIDTEPKILHLLSACPNVLRLHDVYEDNDYIHPITNLCDGGDLFDRISSSSKFSKPDAAAILKQLSSSSILEELMEKSASSEINCCRT